MDINPLTVASVPAIIALVNFAKSLGLSGKPALALAVTLGVLLNVAEHLLGSDGTYRAAVAGLMLGLAAAGVYDITKQPDGVEEPEEPKARRVWTE